MTAPERPTLEEAIERLTLVSHMVLDQQCEESFTDDDARNVRVVLAELAARRTSSVPASTGTTVAEGARYLFAMLMWKLFTPDDFSRGFPDDTFRLTTDAASRLTDYWEHRTAAFEAGTNDAGRRHFAAPSSGTTPEGTPWRCFHCDEVFTSERSAADHFGERDGDEVACKLNRGQGELLTRLREVNREASKLRADLEQAEYDCGAQVRASIGHRFPGAYTVQDAWNQLDSMTGRALAAEEELAALRAGTTQTEGGEPISDATLSFTPSDEDFRRILDNLCAAYPPGSPADRIALSGQLIDAIAMVDNSPRFRALVLSYQAALNKRIAAAQPLANAVSLSGSGTAEGGERE